MSKKLFTKKNIIILSVMIFIMSLIIVLFFKTFAEHQENTELLEKFLPLPPRILTVSPLTISLLERTPFGEIYPEALVKLAVTLEVKTKKERRRLKEYLPEIENIISRTIASKKLIEIDDSNPSRRYKKIKRLKKEIHSEIKEITGLANLNNIFFHEWFVQPCPVPPPPEIKT